LFLTVTLPGKTIAAPNGVEQNLKKKVLYLNKGKTNKTKELYQKIIKPPYSEHENQYLENYDKILKSQELNQTFKDYLKDRHKERRLWVKCYIKSDFTCGIVTSSRIESKHHVYKKYLNGNSRLSEIYSVFQDLEKLEVQNYNYDLFKITNKHNKELENYDLISDSKIFYGAFIVERLKIYILKSLKYQVKSNIQKTTW